MAEFLYNVCVVAGLMSIFILIAAVITALVTALTDRLARTKVERLFFGDKTPGYIQVRKDIEEQVRKEQQAQKEAA